MFYIDENKKPFFDPSEESIKNFDLKYVEKAKWDEIVHESNNPRLTQAQLEADARNVRDELLLKTDKMILIDYSIRDVRLTDEQRNQLISVRDDFKKWPQAAGFPNIEKLPDMPLWLFNESISAGWNAPKEYVPRELLEFYEILN